MIVVNFTYVLVRAAFSYKSVFYVALCTVLIFRVCNFLAKRNRQKIFVKCLWNWQEYLNQWPDLLILTITRRQQSSTSIKKAILILWINSSFQVLHLHRRRVLLLCLLSYCEILLLVKKWGEMGAFMTLAASITTYNSSSNQSLTDNLHMA